MTWTFFFLSFLRDVSSSFPLARTQRQPLTGQLWVSARGWGGLHEMSSSNISNGKKHKTRKSSHVTGARRYMRRKRAASIRTSEESVTAQPQQQRAKRRITQHTPLAGPRFSALKKRGREGERETEGEWEATHVSLFLLRCRTRTGRARGRKRR